jgi:hypothetical protein
MDGVDGRELIDVITCKDIVMTNVITSTAGCIQVAFLPRRQLQFAKKRQLKAAAGVGAIQPFMKSKTCIFSTVIIMLRSGI